MQEAEDLDVGVDMAADMMIARDMTRVEDMRADMADLSTPVDAAPDLDMVPDVDPINRCDMVTCDANEVCQAATGTCTAPQSCKDRQVVISMTPNSPLPSDGFYQLFYQGDLAQPWWAWCEAMRTTEPREYLPLSMTHDNHNVFERFGEPVQPGSVVGQGEGTPTQPLFQRRLTRTRYEKVRVDPRTLRVDVLDDTFSSTEVFQDSEDSLDRFKRSVPFGVSQGCALQLDEARLREDAGGRVDLRNTPFKLDQQWGASGVCAERVDIAPSAQGQALEMSVSGGSRTSPGCGVVAPSELLADYFPSGCDTGGAAITPASKTLAAGASSYAIQLAYIGGNGGLVKPRPKTCREAIALGTCLSDGVCNLFVGRDVDKLWKARCVDMTTADPKTFIEIHRGRSNPEQDNNTVNKVDAAGTGTHSSFYGSLLVDGHTMRADITNTTYANSAPGVQGHQLGIFGVSESCAVRNDAVGVKFARARVTLEETGNNLRLGSSFVPYGDCVKFGDGTSAVALSDPISVERLIYAGETVALSGNSTRVGCGGLAPEPYALKQGYLDCREDGTNPLFRAPRYSTEDAMLFEFVHATGNP